MRNKIPDNKEAKRKSLIITSVLTTLLMLMVFTYSWTVVKETPSIEIAVLFDNEELPEPPEEPIVPKPIISEENSSPSQKNAASNKDVSATGKVNSSKYNHNPPIRSQVQKTESPVDAAPNSQEQNLNKEEVQSDRRTTNSALDNLRRNRNQGGGSDGTETDGRIRGSRTEGQGTGTGTGEGIIGEGGRYLVSKVPGTMGDSSSPLSNPCSASGTVRFKYRVGKSGGILSVYRSGGSSDQCLVDTGVSWIKRHVKANSGDNTAQGTYTINFQ